MSASRNFCVVVVDLQGVSSQSDGKRLAPEFRASITTSPDWPKGKSFSKQPSIWTICCDMEFVSNQLDGPCRVRMHESQGVGQGHGKQRCQWYQHKAGHHVSLLNAKGGKVSPTQVLSQKLKHRHWNVKIQNIWRKMVKQTYSPDSWTI